MKKQFLSISFLLLIITSTIFLTERSIAQKKENYSVKNTNNIVTDLKDLLNQLTTNSDNEIFNLHCQSIIKVIEAKSDLSGPDTLRIIDMYNTFSDTNVTANAGKFSSYIDRRRPLIIAWTSPTDNAVSYVKLMLPENWDPEKSYPLYIELHGLWGVAGNPVDFMTYNLKTETAIESSTYNDGYAIFPWGRGNIWYEGIGETDIWEGIDVIENIFKIDPSRKYLTGHSMGGYGAWTIGFNSVDVWAALGIHAGALQYGSYDIMSSDIIKELKNMPIYFVVGTDDYLFSYNERAFQLLQDEGNEKIKFVTFPGGHDYFEENVVNMYEWLRTWKKENQTEVLSDNNSTPSEFKLYENYPNPFNSSTTIKYSLPEDAEVKIEIYNILGKKITTLYEKREFPGDHQIRWNSKDLPSGIYLCRLSAAGKKLFEKTQKLVLMK